MSKDTFTVNGKSADLGKFIEGLTRKMRKHGGEKLEGSTALKDLEEYKKTESEALKQIEVYKETFFRDNVLKFSEGVNHVDI